MPKFYLTIEGKTVTFEDAEMRAVPMRTDKCKMFENKELIESCKREARKLGDNVVVENEYRIVIHDDIAICIHLKKSGGSLYTNYTEELYRTLANIKMCNRYEYNRGRLQMRVKLPETKGEGRRTYLYRFIYGFNKSGMNMREYLTLTTELGHELIQETIPCREDDGTIVNKSAQVDHADDNIENAFMSNLSLMSDTDNGKKSNLLARIKPPHACFIAVEEDETYRVEINVVNNDGSRQVIRHHCETPKDLIFVLQIANKLCDGKGQNDKRFYYGENVETGFEMSEMLLSMPKEMFPDVKWKK